MKTARSPKLRLLLAPVLSQLPIFPLDQVQLFPRALLPLYVFEPRYRELTADCLQRGGIMAVAALRPGFRDDYYGRPPVRRIVDPEHQQRRLGCRDIPRNDLHWCAPGGSNPVLLPL